MFELTIFSGMSTEKNIELRCFISSGNSQHILDHFHGFYLELEMLDHSFLHHDL